MGLKSCTLLLIQRVEAVYSRTGHLFKPIILDSAVVQAGVHTEDGMLATPVTNISAKV